MFSPTTSWSKKDFSAEANATAGEVVATVGLLLKRDQVNTGVEKGAGVPPHSTIGTGRDIKQQPSSHKANVIGKSQTVLLPLLPFSTPFV